MAEWNDGSSTDSERAFGQPDKSDEGGEDTAAIRAEINETRGRLSDTLNELGERLNPHVVKEQVTERVKEGIREATIGRVEHMARSAKDTVNATRSGITDTIRDNPVPAAMVAVGLAWLLFNGKRESRDTSSYRSFDRYDSGYDSLGESGAYSRSGSSQFAGSYPYDSEFEGDQQSEGRVSRVVGDVRERVGHAAENVADTVKDSAGAIADRSRRLAERGRNLAGRAGQAATSAASNVSHRAADVSRSVATRTTQGARRLEDSFYENPLAIGAVTLAIGVMAGLAAPVSDREVELMGDARDRVADRVRDVAQEAKDKARHVADRVVDETKRAVKEEGMPSLTGNQGGAGAGAGATAQNPT
jgi:gas vesicle protein